MIRGKSRLIWCGLAALALFSTVFTFLAERGLWPNLPAGALHDSDLWIGLAGGVALLWVLFRQRADSTAERPEKRTDEEAR